MKETIVYTMNADDLETAILRIIERHGPLQAPAAPAPAGPEYCTRKEAAAYLTISLPTLHGLMNRGAVVTKKVGSRTLVDLSDLKKKLESGQIAKYKHNR